MKDNAGSINSNRGRNSSLEAFFILTSGVYLITIGLPLFLHPSFDTVGGYASNVLLIRHLQRSSQKTHVNHKSDYLRPNKLRDASKRRVVYLDDNCGYGASLRAKRKNIELEHSQIHFLRDKDVLDENIDSEEDQINSLNNCAPMAEWQSRSFPTCNIFHETNIFSQSPILSQFKNLHMSNSVRFIEQTAPETAAADETGFSVPEPHTAKLLGGGWFRNAWKVANVDEKYNLAMKTLRLDRDYLPEYYELHRRDAVAMERLTASPYIMNIYGYCGNSVMTELAFDEKGIDNLYRMAVRLRDNFTQYVLQTKLQIAAMIAMGLSHVHNVPVEHEVDMKSNNIHQAKATIAHYDFNPRNIIISSDGTPKINDFNCAEFLSWNEKTRESCGFEARFHEPWWRAPEEMTQYNETRSKSASGDAQTTRVDEKVDIYSLGNVLYVLLTGFEPRGKEHKQLRYQNVSMAVSKGEMPTLPKAYAESTDPVSVAIRDAITQCWEPHPEKRVDAVHIAQFLYNALADLKNRQRVPKREI